MKILVTGVAGFIGHHLALRLLARDANALAAAIIQLLDNPARRSAMGRKSREIVVAEFSEARVIAETLAVYALAQAATPRA